MAERKKKSKKDDNIYADDLIYIDLKEQLVKNNNYSSYTEDLLQKYMNFTQIEEMLKEDINTRGVNIYWCNGGGQEGYKKNDSISELAKTNAQKLKLLVALGIKAPERKESGDDDYEV